MLYYSLDPRVTHDILDLGNWGAGTGERGDPNPMSTSTQVQQVRGWAQGLVETIEGGSRD